MRVGGPCEGRRTEGPRGLTEWGERGCGASRGRGQTPRAAAGDAGLRPSPQRVLRRECPAAASGGAVGHALPGSSDGRSSRGEGAWSCGSGGAP